MTDKGKSKKPVVPHLSQMPQLNKDFLLKLLANNIRNAQQQTIINNQMGIIIDSSNILFAKMPLQLLNINNKQNILLQSIQQQLFMLQTNYVDTIKNTNGINTNTNGILSNTANIMINGWKDLKQDMLNYIQFGDALFKRIQSNILCSTLNNNNNNNGSILSSLLNKNNNNKSSLSAPIYYNLPSLNGNNNNNNSNNIENLNDKIKITPSLNQTTPPIQTLGNIKMDDDIDFNRSNNNDNNSNSLPMPELDIPDDELHELKKEGRLWRKDEENFIKNSMKNNSDTETIIKLFRLNYPKRSLIRTDCAIKRKIKNLRDALPQYINPNQPHIAGKAWGQDETEYLLELIETCDDKLKMWKLYYSKFKDRGRTSGAFERKLNRQVAELKKILENNINDDNEYNINDTNNNSGKKRTRKMINKILSKYTKKQLTGILNKLASKRCKLSNIYDEPPIKKRKLQ